MSSLKSRLTMRVVRAHRALAMAIVAAVALAAFAPGVARAQIEPMRLSSASVGLGDGQYARLNVHFVTALDGRGLPPGPCRVTLRFLDARGGIASESVVSLAPGRAAALDYRAPLARGGHANIRAEVIGEPDANGLVPNLIPSIEIIDAATGNTGPVSPGTIRGFNPQPEPPGDTAGTIRGFNPQPEPPGDVGLFGIASGQVARLNVTYVGLVTDTGLPPGPCTVTLTFSSGDGTATATRRVILAPGQSVALDVAAGPLPAGVRRRMWTSFATDGQEQGFLTASVDIFDQASGKAAALLPGSFVGSWGWE